MTRTQSPSPPNKNPFKQHELEYSPADPFAHESFGIRYLVDGLL